MKELIEKKVMKMINDWLEMTWTEDEVMHGKKIAMKPEWNSFIGKLVCRYRSVGWSIKRNVELRSDSMGIPKETLVFKNPAFNVCLPEIRDVDVVF